MKWRRIGMVGALIGIMMLMIGSTCKPNAEEERNRILNAYEPIVQKWFDTNMHDAGNVFVELCDFDKKKEFCDVVTGFYEKADKKYWYWLNVETEAFCSEEYYDLLVQHIQRRLAERVTIDWKEIDIPLKTPVMEGKNGYSTRCPWSYVRFTDDELATIADQEMADGEKEIQILVAEPKKIIADIEKLDVLQEHTNWTFVLQEDREALAYRVYYADGEYHIARAFLDEGGILRYEIWTIPG